MNRSAVFQPSTVSDQHAEKAAAKQEIAALKTALKAAHGYDTKLGEDFVAGELNEEEKLWAESDPELAKFLAMCTAKELASMRRDREQARRERGIGRVQ